MLVLRLLVVVVGVILVALVLAWALTGQRRHLQHAARLLRFTLVVALIAALFFVVERLLLR